MNIRQQLKNNAVALISLAIAISSLGYNTWRNELTENNRNIRQASFEVLMALGELQLISDHAHYSKNRQKGNPIEGWGRVTIIRDLAYMISPHAHKQALQLHEVWSEHWPQLGDNKESISRITAAIASTHDRVMNDLQALK